MYKADSLWQLQMQADTVAGVSAGGREVAGRDSGCTHWEDSACTGSRCELRQKGACRNSRHKALG